MENRKRYEERHVDLDRASLQDLRDGKISEFKYTLDGEEIMVCRNDEGRITCNMNSEAAKKLFEKLGLEE